MYLYIDTVSSTRTDMALLCLLPLQCFQTMTVVKLLEDIRRLTDTIEAREQLPLDLQERNRDDLSDLEAQRSNARTQLNSLLDPMARLPLEIQSQIFCDVASQPTPDPQQPPLIFLNICRLWRAIALNTPELWTHLEIRLHPSGSKADYLDFCKNWIGRAGSWPLSLTLHGVVRLDAKTQELVTCHQHHLGHLTLELSGYSFAEEGLMTRTILLQGPFPVLKTLDVRSHGRLLLKTLNDWIDLLRAAPQLEMCSLENMIIDWHIFGSFAEAPPTQPLILPCLQSLRLGNTQHALHDLDTTDGATALILRYLTLPALHTLHLTVFDLIDAEFTAFLMRSSPPLRSLSMIVSSPLFMEAMRGILQPVPTVISLQLIKTSVISPEMLLRVLESLDGVLPVLHTLTIYMRWGWGLNFGRLARFLHTRRTGQEVPLAVFRLYFAVDNAEMEYVGTDRDMLGEDILAAFRQLAEDGLEMHVGPRGRNLLF
ncbi:hypothetical protein R3P38DRAFT_3257615 [Favolaschia claudopus]|uniref:F-box domain-containing protein n=1 Tax=Favolaschia claudopus TaxID=2862362 RepID=A0AAW0DDF4_9AGAR